MRSLMWTLAALLLLAAPAAHAQYTLADCTPLNNCLIVSGGGTILKDFTLPADGFTHVNFYKADSDHPDVLIHWSGPNETFTTNIVSNGNGTTHNVFVGDVPYSFSGDEQPGYSIYRYLIPASFNVCDASTPAGVVCGKTFNVWGNGTAFLGVNTTDRVGIFMSGGIVPEPAAWALMITGLFGVGAALRRRGQLAQTG